MLDNYNQRNLQPIETKNAQEHFHREYIETNNSSIINSMNEIDQAISKNTWTQTQFRIRKG